jgi:DNA repair protein RadC
MPGSDKTTTSPADKGAHYHGHRRRLRQRFLAAGSEAISDYEMLELILFRAIPQRDVKPLAKDLLATFGSFSEVIAAPVERLKEVDGLGEAAIAELKIVQAAANLGSCAARSNSVRCSHRGRTCSTIAAPPWPSRARSTSAFCSSTKATT